MNLPSCPLPTSPSPHTQSRGSGPGICEFTFSPLIPGTSSLTFLELNPLPVFNPLASVSHLHNSTQLISARTGDPQRWTKEESIPGANSMLLLWGQQTLNLRTTSYYRYVQNPDSPDKNVRVLPAPLKYRVSHLPCDFLLTLSSAPPSFEFVAAPGTGGVVCLPGDLCLPIERDESSRGYALHARERKGQAVCSQGAQHPSRPNALLVFLFWRPQPSMCIVFCTDCVPSCVRAGPASYPEFSSQLSWAARCLRTRWGKWLRVPTIQWKERRKRGERSDRKEERKEG